MGHGPFIPVLIKEIKVISDFYCYKKVAVHIFVHLTLHPCVSISTE